MKSSVNSTKSELLEQLLNSVDEEFGGVMLPPEKQTFILFNEDREVAKKLIEKRKAELLEEFGTLGGFEAMTISWGKPDERTELDEKD